MVMIHYQTRFKGCKLDLNWQLGHCCIPQIEAALYLSHSRSIPHLQRLPGFGVWLSAGVSDGHKGLGTPQVLRRREPLLTSQQHCGHSSPS